MESGPPLRYYKRRFMTYRPKPNTFCLIRYTRIANISSTRIGINMLNEQLMQEVIRRTRYSLNKQTNPQVCAALCTETGIYYGNNIFLSNCGMQCAELAAISSAVSAGDLEITDLYVAGTRTDNKPMLALPCGNCRQAIWDLQCYTGRELEIYVYGWNNSFTIKEMLPDAFQAQGLQRM